MLGRLCVVAMVDANATVPGGAEASYIFAVWNLVIRPPRATYDTSQLGPVEFEIGANIRGQRRDVRLRTQRGLHLQCSHFIPRHDKKKGTKREWQKTPVVIYLHGNASSRLEAGSLVAKLLERNISLFCFDWAGCGLSDGEYISLGWHERDDLAAVIRHLRDSQFNGPIGLWGRSMGAVSALMHADRDPTLAAICLDSPFSSLRELIEEIAQSDRLFLPVPTWLVNGILAVIRSRVKALADFDIEDLVPLNHGPKSAVPALFLHGLQDTFVLPRHSEKLYNNYGGDKEIMMFEGDHNNERNERVIDRGIGFLCRAFRKYELEQSATQHLSDVQVNVAAQDSQPHRIPHLPRPSIQRKALGEITNMDEQQGPGARAKEAEAAVVKKTVSRATSSTSGSGNSTPTSSSGLRAPPRKYSDAGRATTPPRQPMSDTICIDANNSSAEQASDEKGGPGRALANRVYPTVPKAPGNDDLENRAPQGAAADENRRTRSKGPTQRNGKRDPLAAVGGA